MLPIVVCGGSFNSSARYTAVRLEDRGLLDWLTENADPRKVFFAVGHRLIGQEGYIARRALEAGFTVLAFVPRLISPSERTRLRKTGVQVILSIENDGMGLYKSFGYELFRRMPSALLAFDGNSAAMNLIQEARNGREK